LGGQKNTYSESLCEAFPKSRVKNKGGEEKCPKIPNLSWFLALRQNKTRVLINGGGSQKARRTDTPVRIRGKTVPWNGERDDQE